MFESVDARTHARTDEQTPARVPYYKLTLSLRLWWAKNTGQLFFDEESIYEIQKSITLIIFELTEGRKDGRTDEPKAICPFNFFQRLGHKKGKNL